MKWILGVLNEEDGCVYCMPYGARKVLHFSRTEETSLVWEDLGDEQEWMLHLVSFFTFANGTERAVSCLVHVSNFPCIPLIDHTLTLIFIPC